MADALAQPAPGELGSTIQVNSKRLLSRNLRKLGGAELQFAPRAYALTGDGADEFALFRADFQVSQALALLKRLCTGPAAHGEAAHGESAAPAPGGDTEAPVRGRCFEGLHGRTAPAVAWEAPGPDPSRPVAAASVLAALAVARGRGARPRERRRRGGGRVGRRVGAAAQLLAAGGAGGPAAGGRARRGGAAPAAGPGGALAAGAAARQRVAPEAEPQWRRQRTGHPSPGQAAGGPGRLPSPRGSAGPGRQRRSAGRTRRVPAAEDGGGASPPRAATDGRRRSGAGTPGPVAERAEGRALQVARRATCGSGSWRRCARRRPWLHTGSYVDLAAEAFTAELQPASHITNLMRGHRDSQRYWPLDAFAEYLRHDSGGRDTFRLRIWPQARDIVRRVFQALQAEPSAMLASSTRLKRLGVDLLVDTELTVWLVEFNVLRNEYGLRGARGQDAKLRLAQQLLEDERELKSAISSGSPPPARWEDLSHGLWPAAPAAGAPP